MRIRRLIAAAVSSVMLLCGCSVNSAVKEREQEPLPPTAEGKLEELTCYCFKAGKADAHLIWNSDLAILIDCGEKGFGKEIVDYMSKAGIKKLDMLIVTHFDKDHVGGAAKLLRSVPVDRVIQSNCIKESEEYSEYAEQLKALGKRGEILSERQSFRLGNAEVTIYPPMRQSYPDEPSNNSSLITSVRYGSKSLLFAGDAEDLRMNEFIAREGGRSYDFLKVPYHGHFQSRLGAFLNDVRPKIAVITSSDEIPEDRAVMKMLSDLGAETYLTRTAPVIVKCDGESISAHYEEK